MLEDKLLAVGARDAQVRWLDCGETWCLLIGCSLRYEARLTSSNSARCAARESLKTCSTSSSAEPVWEGLGKYTPLRPSTQSERPTRAHVKVLPVRNERSFTVIVTSYRNSVCFEVHASL